MELREKPINKRKELKVDNFTCKRLKEVFDNNKIKVEIRDLV